MTTIQEREGRPIRGKIRRRPRSWRTNIICSHHKTLFLSWFWMLSWLSLDGPTRTSITNHGSHLLNVEAFSTVWSGRTTASRIPSKTIVTSEIHIRRTTDRFQSLLSPSPSPSTTTITTSASSSTKLNMFFSSVSIAAAVSSPPPASSSLDNCNDNDMQNFSWLESLCLLFPLMHWPGMRELEHPERRDQPSSSPAEVFSPWHSLELIFPLLHFRGLRQASFAAAARDTKEPSREQWSLPSWQRRVQTNAAARIRSASDAVNAVGSLQSRTESPVSASSCPFTTFMSSLGVVDQRKGVFEAMGETITPTTNANQLRQRHFVLPFPNLSSLLLTKPTHVMLQSTREAVWEWQDQHYTRALAQKCPFWRRRTSDAWDALDHVLGQVWKQLVLTSVSSSLSRDLHRSSIPHETATWTPIAWRNVRGPAKVPHLSLDEITDALKRDWKCATATTAGVKAMNVNKGYYVTGRLNTTLYRDDCLFDGPDPDMPVHGLRKYQNAANQLFCPKTSRAELLDMWIHEDDDSASSPKILARWRLKGRLRLPWRPELPEVHGTTTYHLDPNDHLIYKHTETWDNLTPIQAFVRTFLVVRPWGMNKEEEKGSMM